MSLVDLEEEIFTARSLEELRERADNYVRPLGWRFNFGANADYPESIFIPEDHTDEPGNPYVEENDIDRVMEHVYSTIRAASAFPIEYWQSTDLQTVNMFEAWYWPGNAAYDRPDSHHIAMAVYSEPGFADGLFFHEESHVDDMEKCQEDREFRGPDLPFANLNAPGFEYGETAEELNPHRFGNIDASVSVQEDRASAGRVLMQEGLLPIGHPRYDDILEQKKRLLATRINDRVPGMYDFLVAKGLMHALAES